MDKASVGQRAAGLEQHPERRFKAAFEAYKERELPNLRAEHPGLRLQQYQELLYKQFQKSPENPFNQVTVSYDASQEEKVQALKNKQAAVENRLQPLHAFPLFSTTMAIRISIPPSPAHSSPASSSAPSPTSTTTTRTNTLVIASLPPSFFEHVVLETLRTHFASYGEIHTWAPIKAFARIIVVYYDEDAAEQAKQICDSLQIDETDFSPAVLLRVFRADPTPLDQLTNPNLLRPPKLEKNFLISPPGSPPVGWEPVREEPPNSTPLAEDLMAALRKLQLEQEGKGGIEVLIKPEDASGIGIYVEDCDDGFDKDVGEVEEWPYGPMSLGTVMPMDISWHDFRFSPALKRKDIVPKARTSGTQGTLRMQDTTFTLGQKMMQGSLLDSIGSTYREENDCLLFSFMVSNGDYRFLCSASPSSLPSKLTKAATSVARWRCRYHSGDTTAHLASLELLDYGAAVHPPPFLQKSCSILEKVRLSHIDFAPKLLFVRAHSPTHEFLHRSASIYTRRRFPKRRDGDVKVPHEDMTPKTVVGSWFMESVQMKNIVRAAAIEPPHVELQFCGGPADKLAGLIAELGNMNASDDTNADTATDLPRSSGFLDILNDDIRSTIFHMLKNRHLFSTMRTCRVLFQQGLPVLLGREHYFPVYSPRYGAKSEPFAHFYNFLCFTAPSSFPSLRSITFAGFADENESQLDMVADTLRRAENLQQLVIDDEDLICSDTVAEAVASLAKLQRLSLGNEDLSKTCMILHSLQAPLVYLDASFGCGCFDPIPLLYNFQHTLEELHLSYAELNKVPNFSCSKITRLNIYYGRPVLLSVLVNAFPNLKVLILRSGYGDIGSTHPMEDIIREKNTTFQRQQRWQSLVSLTIDPCALYAMRLQSQVDSVVLPLSVEISHSDVPWLASSLSSLRPQHLQLSLWDDPSDLSDVLWTVRERLERLDITVDVSDGTPLNVMDIILDAIRPLRLKMLYLNFECSTADYVPEDIDTAWSIVDSLEPKEIACQAMAAAPSLQYVKLEFQFDRTDDLTYWKISTQDKDDAHASANPGERSITVFMVGAILILIVYAFVGSQDDFYTQENWSWSD
ncbi:hypothetical protein NM688_g7593 [Phlebia brevispora]|uniref:Uncharacterized protein n=1 Tax=Phlebia brevispora TaxID=194682 RepID=A0ACC1S3J6_9APHY|nr:hypothetical protein NM688_g7593 [Phlebia brevispora]